MRGTGPIPLVTYVFVGGFVLGEVMWATREGVLIAFLLLVMLTLGDTGPRVRRYLRPRPYDVDLPGCRCRAPGEPVDVEVGGKVVRVVCTTCWHTAQETIDEGGNRRYLGDDRALHRRRDELRWAACPHDAEGVIRGLYKFCTQCGMRFTREGDAYPT